MRATRPFSCAISAAVALALHPAAARADLAGVTTFRIPPQSLSSALIQFSNQADVQVVGNTETLANLDTAGVSGELTGREALRQLLGNLALRFEEVSSRSVKILPPAPESASERRPGDPGWSVVVAQGPGGRGIERWPNEEPLEEVLIRGLNFKFGTVETAHKMSRPVKDTPQSVKVITADMLDFSGISSFEDVYKVDAGSHTSHAQDGFVRNYFRGFKLDSADAVKLDGMRMPGTMVLDLAPFERFEIIKGSTSTIYGQGLVAGTLNAVSKKPGGRTGGSVALQSGRFGHRRGEIDVQGALAGEGRLSGRLVGAYLDEDSYLDYACARHVVLAPSLRYEFGAASAVTLLTQYQEQDFLQSFGFGVQYLGDPASPAQLADPANYLVPEVPRSRFVALPTGGKHSELAFGRLMIEHALPGGWQLRGNLQYANTRNRADGSLGIATNAAGLTNLEMYHNARETESYGGEVNLFGEVALGGREHTLFLGIDQLKSEDDEGLYAYASLPGSRTGFSIFAPDYSLLPRAPSSILGYTTADIPQADYSEFGNGRSYSRESGITLQALLRVTGRLSVLLGGRYSDVAQGSTMLCCDASVLTAAHRGYETEWGTHATTFQAGVTFALTDDVNAYASAGDTFTPRLRFTYDPAQPEGPGRRVGPEEGTAYEIGLKGEALGRQVAWSFAAFEIARTHIAETDRVHGSPYVVLLGEQRARGLELDVQGQIAAGWDVYGSAAILENEFVDGLFPGYPSFTAPRSGLSLFTSYEIQGGALKGLGFGGGVVYKERGSVRAFFGGAAGQDFDRLFDDATEVDLRAFYGRGSWKLHFAATNVLGSRYYSPEDNNFYYAVAVNPGRQLTGKVTYRF
jgi:iron complex outermembrane receptor protein